MTRIVDHPQVFPTDQRTSAKTQTSLVGGDQDSQQQTKVVPLIPRDLASAAGSNFPADQRKSAQTQLSSVGGEVPTGSLLRAPWLDILAAALDDLEGVRIAQANRLRILTTSEDVQDSDGQSRGFGLDSDHPAIATVQGTLELIGKAEHATQLALARELRRHPLHPWIKAQVGLGDKQVARLLASIGDPYWNFGKFIDANGVKKERNRPRSLAELWAYCGLHVVHADGAAGVAPARTRGQKVSWNMMARTRIYVVAESCMKNRRSPYRAVYDAGRVKYADAIHFVECRQCGTKGKPAPIGSDLRDGHKHARAMRLTMKAVLRDLWIEARNYYDRAAES